MKKKKGEEDGKEARVLTLKSNFLKRKQILRKQNFFTLLIKLISSTMHSEKK